MDGDDRAHVAASVDVLGCRVDDLDAAQAVAHVVDLARSGTPALVVTLGTEMVMRARSDPRFRALVNGATLVLCDTIGVLAAARARGLSLRERVTGIDLIEPLCAVAAHAELPFALVGSRGDTAARAGAALAERHHGLCVVYARDGYFSDEEAPRVAAEILASGAKVALVGLGSPRQEAFIAEHLAVPGGIVGVGIGGSLDVLAGNVERAPEQWRRAHLEWLYRLVKEPSRLRRQLVLPQFALLAAGEFAASRLQRRRPQA